MSKLIEIVNAEITPTDKAFVAKTIEGGVVYSNGKGVKVTANLTKGIADAIKAQTGATVTIKSTKLWSGDRNDVRLVPLACTTSALKVDTGKTLELTFTLDDDATLTGTASVGSVKVNSKEKKATFTAPAEAGKATLTFTETKQGFSVSISVEVEVTTPASAS